MEGDRENSFTEPPEKDLHLQSLADNEGDRNLTDSNIAISFPEPPPEKHIQVQSSAINDQDEEEELTTPKESGDLDDPISNLHLEIEALRRENLDLQRRLTSSSAGFEGKLSRMQQALILNSSEADSARAETDTTKKALEDQKNDLEDRVRYLEGQMLDLKMMKDLEADNFLKKESELRLVVQDLNAKAEKAKTALIKKEEEINTFTKELNKWKEKANAEKEKINYYVANEKEVVTSLEEKLLVMREKNEELIAEREKVRLTIEKKDEVITSLTEELRIEREKERDILDMEKKFAAVMAKKEDEFVSLKKDLMFAKENQEFGNKELEEELKLLKDDVSNLEERIKKILSADKDGRILQSSGGMERNKVEVGHKVSWVTAATIMASIGAATGTITFFCLRQNKHG